MRTDYGQDKLSQKLFAAGTLSCLRERFTADDSYSQDVEKRLFRVILGSGEFELSFCVVYTNNCRKKSSTHFRQRCSAFFACQDRQLGRHKRLKYHLQIIHRQLGDSPEQVRFRDLVRHASQEGLSREEWEFLDSRTERKLTSEVRKLFDNAACLYTTRNDVNDLNLTELQALNQPCARINARHDGGSDAAKAPPDKAGGLEFRIVLAKHAKVMITRNIWQNQGV